MAMVTLKEYCEQNELQYILDEWNYEKNSTLTPEVISFASNKKVWWKCKMGHEWEATVHNRSEKKSRCPYCTNKKLFTGFNDLATLYPDIAAEWHPTLNGELKPSDVLPGIGKKVWWICPEGHAYQASLNSRTTNKSGCPYCAGVKVLAGFNDLATKYPELAKQWHPALNGDLAPDMVMPGCNKKVWWVCAEGHVWDAVVKNRALKGYGCPVCANNSKKGKHTKSAQEIIASFDEVETPITVCLFRIGMEPELVSINNTREEMERLVGGDIEIIRPWSHHFYIVLNRYRNDDNLPLNRTVYEFSGEKIAELRGDFLVTCRPPVQRGFVSVTEEMVQSFKNYIR